MPTPYTGNIPGDPVPDIERGTEGTAFGHVIDANAYYNAPVAEPEPTKAPNSHDEVVVDPKPALAGAGPQYGSADAEPEGVDMPTLPAFKDLRRMLPSERLKVQMKTAKVATALPEHLKNVESSGGLDFDSLTPDDLDALTNVIAAVEETVLDNAADRGAMAEWLIAQEEPLNAVMAAFTKFTDRLGN